MANLSEFQGKSTVDLIYEYHKKKGDSHPVRGYLGASIIGHPCERYLWYCFRQACAPDFSGRMYRLFETGDLAENRFTRELRAIGCEVHDHQPPPADFSEGHPNGEIYEAKQFEITDFGGHFSGHMDGCALGLTEAPKTWHVLEYKTHNNKSFKKLQKEGVKKSKPMHYAQMQAYMYKTGMKRALYLAVNKDTDELYMERVYYDKSYCEGLMEKAKRIITASDPPPRISERRDYYICGWCDAKAVCHGTEQPEPALTLPSLSCRQCCHATPNIEGDGAQWKCEKVSNKEITDTCQGAICADHLILPGLISFSKPTNNGVDEEGNDFIEFMNTDGLTWKHGRSGFSTLELCTISAENLTNEVIKEAKESFGAEVKSTERDLLPEYPDKPVWKGPSCDLFKEWKRRYKEDLKDLKPVRKCQMFDYGCLEYKGVSVDSRELDFPDRLVVAYKDSTAEIREGIPF